MNEVPKKLFDFYADAKPNSSFGILKARSNLYTTSTADLGHLSPWVTWPTLHRGVSNVEHKISDLGEDLSRRDEALPPIWKILASQGVSVGVFGSLHSYNLANNLEDYKFFVPDTFAAGPECFPEDLNAFQKFNLSMVMKNGKNVTSKIAMHEAAEFLLKAPYLGLRGATMLRLAKQVMEEKLNPDRLVRRRTSQAEIAFDFYYKQLQKTKPDVSFFFTNHVASSMHRYWPTIFPKDYEEGKFDASWLKQWSMEIPHAVRVADQQLSLLINFAKNNGYRLVVLSSMGQGAVDDAEAIHSQILITDLKALMAYLGFSADEWEPKLAMAPQVVASVDTDGLEARLKVLDEIRVNGETLNYKIMENVGVQFDIHCFNQEAVNAIDGNGDTINPADLGLSVVHLQDAAAAYAYHIPEGILLEYDPSKTDPVPQSNWEHVSVLDVAPSLLKQFNVDKPGYMTGDDSLFKKAG